MDEKFYNLTPEEQRAIVHRIINDPRPLEGSSNSPREVVAAIYYRMAETIVGRRITEEPSPEPLDKDEQWRVLIEQYLSTPPDKNIPPGPYIPLAHR